MYDLEPVRLSSRSEYLNITEETENKLSPQRHSDKLFAPVIISHGTNESPEFIRQSNEFAQAIEKINKTVDYVIGIDLNHFEILETLADQSGLLAISLLKMIQKNSEYTNVKRENLIVSEGIKSRIGARGRTRTFYIRC